MFPQVSNCSSEIQCLCFVWIEYDVLHCSVCLDCSEFNVEFLCVMFWVKGDSLGRNCAFPPLCLNDGGSVRLGFVFWKVQCPAHLLQSHSFPFTGLCTRCICNGHVSLWWRENVTSWPWTCRTNTLTHTHTHTHTHLFSGDRSCS